MVRSFLSLLAAGVVMMRLVSAANADEKKLIFATLTPTDGHQNVDIFHPWAEHINEVGKGIVHIDVRDGFSIANRDNFYNRVLDDVVQIAWGPQGSIGGQFPQSEIVSLPFETQKSVDGSVAFWRLYKTGLLDKEYKDIVPLWMVSESNLTLHMSKPLKTLNNLDGEKILVPTKLNGDAVERLGGTPLALPFEDAYTALQRDTVDGMLFPWTGVQTFKLADVTTYHADTPFGGGAGMVFMSREKFDSLPPQVQKILQDNSGEAMAHRHGESLDKVQDEIRTAVKADPKQQVVMLSPRQGDSWHQRLASLADTWAKNTPDGEKVLATYRQLVAQVKASR